MRFSLLTLLALVEQEVVLVLAPFPIEEPFAGAIDEYSTRRASDLVHFVFPRITWVVQAFQFSVWCLIPSWIDYGLWFDYLSLLPVVTERTRHSLDDCIVLTTLRTTLRVEIAEH